MRRTLAMVALLAASAALGADDGLVSWVPKLPPPPPEEEGLVPWGPGALAELIASREPKGEEALLARRRAAGLHRAVLAAQARLARTHRTVEVEDVLLDGRDLADRPLAVLAIPSFVNVATNRPACELSGGSLGPKVLASLAAMPFARRRELLFASAETHVMFFIGRLRLLDGDRRYFDAEDFVDVGRIPAHTVTETHAILTSTVPVRSHRRDQIEALERTGRVMNDRDWPYVPLDKLIADPASRLDRKVSTIGFCDFHGLVADGSAPNCRFQDRFFAVGIEFIEVLLSKLDREERAQLVRGRRFAHALGVRGHVRKAPNGAYFLEAEHLDGVGFGSSIELVLNPTYFDSREYRAQLAAMNEAATRALKEARSWKAPLVEVEDLILSPEKFRGAVVAVLGVTWGTHRGPDGLAGSFGYESWHMPAFAVRLERAPAAKRASAAGWTEEPRILLVRGRVREKEGRGYVDAEDFVDVGETPKAIRAVRQVLEYPPKEPKPVPVVAVRAAVAELKRDRSRAYVLFEDLVLDPRRWQGRAVWVVGSPQDPVIGDSVRRFTFRTNFLVNDRIAATMDRLERGRQKELLRLVADYRLVALAAKVKTAKNGAFYLEAEGFRDLAPLRWDVSLNAIR